MKGVKERHTDTLSAVGVCEHAHEHLVYTISRSQTPNIHLRDESKNLNATAPKRRFTTITPELRISSAVHLQKQKHKHKEKKT